MYTEAECEEPPEYEPIDPPPPAASITVYATKLEDGRIVPGNVITMSDDDYYEANDLTCLPEPTNED